MTRRNIRENVIKLLFLSDFHDVNEIDEQKELYFQLFFDPQSLTEEDKNEIISRYDLVCSKLGEIETIINSASQGWRLERIGRIELSILRLAVYEIIYDEDIPGQVAVNEAVEISKAYCNEFSYSFVNGVLAKILK